MKALLQKGWQHAGWLNWLLLPVTWLYTLAVLLRKSAYGLGIFNSHQIAVPVIVVGNISVGGTGKTPCVIALVKHLEQRGWKPGVISRGYGGDSAFWPRIVTQGDSAGEVGDESLLIQQRTQVPVVVGPERVRSAHMLVENYQCNIVISDDGFQHFALKRDIDIVVIDGSRRFGNGWCLPSGPLREPVSGLKRAQIRIVNGAAAADRLDTTDEFSMQMTAGEVYQLDDRDTCQALSWFEAKRVHAVAGLGNPERFFNTLIHADVDFEPHAFNDHHEYQHSDFSFVTGKDVVIMTEKDAVKCAGLLPSGVAWVLPVEATFMPEFFESIDARLTGSGAK